VYFGWISVLLGASFAAALADFRYQPAALRLPRGFEFYGLLRMLGRFVEYRRRGHGLTSDQIGQLEPMLSDSQVQHLIGQLHRIGVVDCTETGPWVLTRDLDTLTLEELYEGLAPAGRRPAGARGGGGTGGITPAAARALAAQSGQSVSAPFRFTVMMHVRPVCLLLSVCFLLACQREATVSDAAAPEAPNITDAATGGLAEAALDRFEWPSLQLETVTGEPWDLADHHGHWVVVNFWATWCAPCRKEMPELSELHARRGDINVVGLAYEEIEVEELRAFLVEYPVSYPIAIVDVHHPPADFATPRGLPTTWLITPEGQIARQFLGPVTAEQIEGVVASVGEVKNPPAERVVLD